MVESQGNLDGRGVGVGVFFEEGGQGFGFERVKIGIVDFFYRKVRKGLRKGCKGLIVRFLTAKWAKIYAKIRKVFFWHADPDGSGAVPLERNF